MEQTVFKASGRIFLISCCEDQKQPHRTTFLTVNRLEADNEGIKGISFFL